MKSFSFGKSLFGSLSAVAEMASLKLFVGLLLFVVGCQMTVCSCLLLVHPKFFLLSYSFFFFFFFLFRRIRRIRSLGIIHVSLKNPCTESVILFNQVVVGKILGF